MRLSGRTYQKGWLAALRCHSMCFSRVMRGLIRRGAVATQPTKIACLLVSQAASYSNRIVVAAVQGRLREVAGQVD